MIIGHVNLDRAMNGIGEHFIALVEALDRRGHRQHVIAHNPSLAGRVRLYDSVTVGPTTGSPVVAYCLMPRVDVIHAHDPQGARTALLLRLTRGLPFVLTRRFVGDIGEHALSHSMHRRASRVICTTKELAEDLAARYPESRIDVIGDVARNGCADVASQANRTAAAHLRIYHDAIDQASIPAMLL